MKKEKIVGALLLLALLTACGGNAEKNRLEQGTTPADPLQITEAENTETENGENDNEENDNRENDNEENDNGERGNEENDNGERGNEENDNEENDNEERGIGENDNEERGIGENDNGERGNEENDNEERGIGENDNEENDMRGLQAWNSGTGSLKITESCLTLLWRSGKTAIPRRCIPTCRTKCCRCAGKIPSRVCWKA